MTVTVDYREANVTIVKFAVRGSTTAAAINRAQLIARKYGIENPGNTPTYVVSFVDDTSP